MTRFVAWWAPVRIIGAAALIAGAGLIYNPDAYANPAYRVLFDHVTARQAGIAWALVGLAAMTVRPWAVALLGSALIGWGLGFAAAAWMTPRSGSPWGWCWYVAWGIVALRQLATGAPSVQKA